MWYTLCMFYHVQVKRQITTMASARKTVTVHRFVEASDPVQALQFSYNATVAPERIKSVSVTKISEARYVEATRGRV